MDVEGSVDGAEESFGVPLFRAFWPSQMLRPIIAAAVPPTTPKTDHGVAIIDKSRDAKSWDWAPFAILWSSRRLVLERRNDRVRTRRVSRVTLTLA